MPQVSPPKDRTEGIANTGVVPMLPNGISGVLFPMDVSIFCDTSSDRLMCLVVRV